MNKEKKYEISKGLIYISNFIKLTYISKRSGKCNSIISAGIRHSARNGKPYYFDDSMVSSFESLVHSIGYDLLNTSIHTTPQNDIIIVGNTFIEKFKSLGEVVHLPYIFNERMGWTTKQKLMRLSQKDNSCYNKFTTEHIEQVNSIIREIAIELLSISFVIDRQD